MSAITYTELRQAQGQTGSARWLRFALSVALSLGVILAVAMPATLSAARASTAQQGEEEQAAVPASVAAPIKLANTRLARLQQRAAQGMLGKAIVSSRNLRASLADAHRAGMALIGAPPTDPESDDLPGPPAVLAVLGLEHRINARVVPLFDGATNAEFVHALRQTLRASQRTRDVMLDRVIGLNPEGAGADYADGMADTVGLYATEVTQLTTALNQYTLTGPGRAGLTNALTRARATKAKVDKAWGGGE